MKKLLVFLALTALILSCNTTEPLPPGTNITLKTEDVSSIEAWIKITTTNLQLPTTVTLKKNNAVEQTISLLTQDSVIYIDSLLPKTTYTFQASIHTNTQTYESNELSVETMDTTSHDFTWQTFTFGEHSSSVFYDVAVIDENNIWAVGEIFMNDSLGNPDPNAYNAVHWDGSEWKLRRIKTNACGGVIYPPIKAIFAFSANDILFAHIDGSITYYNGIEFINDCSLITQLNGSANKIWGTSKNDYYVVSGNGFIAHYTNGQWKKIESGTDADIKDVWGVEYSDGEKILYCVVHNKILQINNLFVKNIQDWVSGRDAYTIWFNSPYKLYVAGSGIFYKNINNGWIEITNLPMYGTLNLRGTGLNNIMVVGGFGFAVHYNGLSWRVYNELTLSNGNYKSVSSKGNIMVIIGITNNKGIIIIGKNN